MKVIRTDNYARETVADKLISDGLSKEAAETIAAYFGTTSTYAGLGYSAYTATDRKGRTWKAMSDMSINAEKKQSGAKVVMKNNTAECVLLSPEEYVRLIDELNDARLLALANERLAKTDPASFISEEEMEERLGVRAEDLAGFDEVDIE